MSGSRLIDRTRMAIDEYNGSREPSKNIHLRSHYLASGCCPSYSVVNAEGQVITPERCTSSTLHTWLVGFFAGRRSAGLSS